MLLALDYRTGKPRWSRVSGRGSGRLLGEGGEGNGILTTAGRLLFTNESTRLVALDPATGKVLWSMSPGGYLSGGPTTYELGAATLERRPSSRKFKRLGGFDRSSASA
jgi:alcohol dehydrogenase (cytochrome c)